MGKKEERLRLDGVAYAYDFITRQISAGKTSDDAIKALKNEIDYRGITGANLAIPRSEIERYQNELKMNCVYIFKVATLVTVRDEFGFGKKRMQQFVDRFMDKIECLITDDPDGNAYATWQDYADILLEECGIEIDVPEAFRVEAK